MTGVRTYFVVAALAASAAALPAHAQQPSKEQTDAVRGNCRSDFMSKCMSVKPGGIEAIQCLKKNDASLSPACRSAVAAIKLPGEAPAAAAPAKPASPPPAAAVTPAPSTQPAPAPAATAPKPAEPAAAVATPTKPEPPKPTQAKPVTAPKPAVASAPPAPAPVAAPPPPSSAPKPPSLQEAALVRRFCAIDYRMHCKGTPLGGGRVVQCLAAHQSELSPGCKAAVANAQ